LKKKIKNIPFANILKTFTLCYNNNNINLYVLTKGNFYIMENPKIEERMCQSIIKNNQNGLYNGAYQAVKLAVQAAESSDKAD